MAKTKISNGDLTAIFNELLREAQDCPLGINLAITPDSGSGWTVLMSKAQRVRHPVCAERVEAIQKRLRAIYDLARD